MISQWQAAEVGSLLGWTIYARPLDYPHHYVARAWITGGPVRHNASIVSIGSTLFQADPVAQGVSHAIIGCICASVEEARTCIGWEFSRVPRQPGDFFSIVESWV